MYLVAVGSKAHTVKNSSIARGTINQQKLEQDEYQSQWFFEGNRLDS